MQGMAAALLTAALAGLWAFLHSGWPPVPHRLARRAVRHIVWFGGMTLLGLLALGQWRAPSQTPAVFDPARALVVALVGARDYISFSPSSNDGGPQSRRWSQGCSTRGTGRCD